MMFACRGSHIDRYIAGYHQHHHFTSTDMIDIVLLCYTRAHYEVLMGVMGRAATAHHVINPASSLMSISHIYTIRISSSLIMDEGHGIYMCIHVLCMSSLASSLIIRSMPGGRPLIDVPFIIVRVRVILTHRTTPDDDDSSSALCAVPYGTPQRVLVLTLVPVL